MGNGTEPGLTFPTSLGLWCYVEMTSQFPHCSSTAAANILDSLFPDNPSEQDKFKYFSPLFLHTLTTNALYPLLIRI